MRNEVMHFSASGRMKGGDKGKVDGVKQQQGGLEAGALFPRLHVKEANKVGPRAPPRNKMALYEQFTIPSHRFMPVPGSERKAAAASVAPQLSGHDRRYMYPQASPLGYTTVAVGRQFVGQRSLGSSTSSVVDCDGELHVPGVSQVESPAPCSGLASANNVAAHLTGQRKSALGKKHKNEDSVSVPTCSAPRRSKRVMSFLLDKSGVQGVQEHSSDLVHGTASDFYGKRPVQHRIVPWGREGHDTTESTSGNNGMGTEQSRLTDAESSGSMLCSPGKPKTVPSNLYEKRKSPQGCRWPDQQSQPASGVRCPEQASFSDFWKHPAHKVIQPGAVRCTRSEDCARACNEDTCGETRGSSVFDDSLARKSRLQEKIASAEERNRDGLGDPKASPNDRKHQSYRRRKSSSFENSGDSQHRRNESGLHLPEPSLVGRSTTGDYSDSHLMESVSIQRITPKDVIGAVGQQEFWRMRKAIIRQQQIFSIQVFELHRLVKIQECMAMSSNRADYAASMGLTSESPVESGFDEQRVRELEDHGTCSENQEKAHPVPQIAVETECLTEKDCASKEAPQSLSMDFEAGVYHGSISQGSTFAPQATSTSCYLPHPSLGVDPCVGGNRAHTYQYSRVPAPFPLLHAYGPYQPLNTAPQAGDKLEHRPPQFREEQRGKVIKVAPRPVVATPESTAGILLSIQQERRR